MERIPVIYRNGNEDAKQDIITLNSLLNACTYTNYVDDEKATTSVHIAIKSFHLLFVEEDLDTPNHLTYGSLLMLVKKLVKDGNVQTDVIKSFFRSKCCQNGH